MKLPENMSEILTRVQEFQSNVGKVQSDLEKQEVEASAGGGMVTVKVSGAQMITGLSIDKTVIDPNDSEMLEDLVRAAVNEGLRKSRELMKSELMKVTGGLPIPGLS